MCPITVVVAHLLLSAPAAGTRRQQLSIDIFCPQGAQQQMRKFNIDFFCFIYLFRNSQLRTYMHSQKAET